MLPEIVLRTTESHRRIVVYTNEYRKTQSELPSYSLDSEVRMNSGWSGAPGRTTAGQKECSARSKEAESMMVAEKDLVRAETKAWPLSYLMKATVAR